MAISTELRRTGIFTCNGTVRAFPFAFKIFDTSQVTVVVSVNGIESEADPSTYTVTLNADQDNNPGGTVTLATAPAKNTLLVILSAVDYLQLMVLTSRGAFLPTLLNEAFDKATAQIQQLKEGLSRAVTVDATDTMTPKELKHALLDVAVKAQEYADAAQAVLDEVNALREYVLDEVSDEGDAQVARVAAEGENRLNAVIAAGNEQVALVEFQGNAQAARLETGVREALVDLDQAKVDAIEVIDAEGDTQDQRVIEEGDLQSSRIRRAVDAFLHTTQYKCLYDTMLVSEAIAAGATISLPGDLFYVVDADHLRVSCNGVLWYKGLQYAEVGGTFTISGQITTNIQLSAGDILEFWVIPLGGEINEETGEVVPDEGAKCQSETWTVTADTEGPVTITLPNSMTYVVGKEHLVMSYNGLLLSGTNGWIELGNAGELSTQVQLYIDLKAGDVLNAWSVPYDRGQSQGSSAIETLRRRVIALEQSLSSLEDEVAYTGNGSSSTTP